MGELSKKGVYTAILADDDEFARAYLIELIEESYNEINLVGIATDGHDARELIDTYKPDLAFLDIDMPRLSGIKAAATAKHSPLVIFITGHETYAVESFKAYTVDYLVKPFKTDAFFAAVEKFKRMQILETKAKPRVDLSQKLKIRINDSIRYVPFQDIVCCEAMGKQSKVYTQQETLVSDKSLSDLETVLPAEHFVRIHRSHIVNFSYVQEILSIGNSRCKVILNIPFEKALIGSRENIDKIKSF